MTDEVPVATDATNRFFEDDIPEFPEVHAGEKFVSITDLGGATETMSFLFTQKSNQG